MIRTADFKVDFFNILSQDTADKLNAMTGSEIAIITRRITNNRVRLDDCNKSEMLRTLKNWLKYREPAKSTEIDRYIITRQDESKFIAGKVYNGDISKDNYTIISRTAKTVMIIRNNNEYSRKPRKCSILRQNNTEYLAYAGEFIYSFNEDANVNPVLLEEKKTEPRVKFEIGQTYISTSGYYDEDCRCERYGYYTVIARTDKTVTFVEEESLKPENIIIDANTGKRIYHNDFYKPARRNIEIDDNGVEKARLDVLYAFSAEKYKGSDEKKDSFIEGYGEVITVEAKEFQEPAELTINAEFSEVKAIAAKTENNTATPAVIEAPKIIDVEAAEIPDAETPAPVKKSITKKYESDEDASESADLAIKDLAKVDTPEEMREILNNLTRRALEYVAIRENINFSCPPAHKRSKKNLIDGIIYTITERNKRIDAGEKVIKLKGVKLTPLGSVVK